MKLALAVLALAALTVLIVASERPASATSPPSADMFAIDMVPDFPPANTATSVGPIFPCARINENDVLDADEDAVDAKDIDIVTAWGGIPAANPMTGYDYTLNYNFIQVRVTSQTPMLIDSPGSNPVVNSDPLPDADGQFVVSVDDPGGPAESGPGVLDRIRIESQPAAFAQVDALTLTNASHTDTQDQQHTPDATQAALILINTVGCGGINDMGVIDHSVDFPAQIAAGFPRAMTVQGAIHNYDILYFGPSIDAETTLTLPGDCTANGQPNPAVLSSTLTPPLPGESEPFENAAEIVCSSGGPASITVESCPSLPPFDVDIYRPNDCATEVINFDVDDGDTDGDGFSDAVEVGTSLCGNGINDDDADDAVIDDGCLGGPPQAGSFSEGQFNVGTDWQVACSPGGSIAVWPAELAVGGVPESTNKINILDLAAFVAPTRHFMTSPGHPDFDKRYDIVPGRGPLSQWINIIDLATLVTVKPPAPPFAGESRAFLGPSPC